MSFEYLCFYFFRSFLIISSTMLIVVKNPVHSVLYLIVSFVNGSILFLLLRVEFLAILFLIVYIRAVAILFLFVIMMLNIKLVEFNESFVRFMPIGFLLGMVFIYQVLSIVWVNLGYYSFNNEYFINWSDLIISFTNIEVLGQRLFIHFYFLFLIASYILLVSMVGAIILSLSEDSFVKKQDLYYQVSSNLDQSVVLVR